jgi:hypothetical protein
MISRDIQRLVAQLISRNNLLPRPRCSSQTDTEADTEAHTQAQSETETQASFSQSR